MVLMTAHFSETFNQVPLFPPIYLRDENSKEDRFGDPSAGKHNLSLEEEHNNVYLFCTLFKFH